MTTHDIALPGSLKTAQPLRLCQGRCGRERVPEGGAQVSPKKWVCAGCWRNYMRRTS